MNDNELSDNEQPSGPDPLVASIRKAAVHLGKAGFEVIAAIGVVSKGVMAKVRPDEPDDPESGPQRVRVD
jgi:hypothetical protein